MSEVKRLEEEIERVRSKPLPTMAESQRVQAEYFRSQTLATLEGALQTARLVEVVEKLSRIVLERSGGGFGSLTPRGVSSASLEATVPQEEGKFYRGQTFTQERQNRLDSSLQHLPPLGEEK